MKGDETSRNRVQKASMFTSKTTKGRVKTEIAHVMRENCATKESEVGPCPEQKEIGREKGVMSHNL